MASLGATVPSWFSLQSSEAYLLGNGLAVCKNKKQLAEAMETAKNEALQAISAQIYSEVHSSISSSETAGETYSQHYAKEVQISSSIRLCGYEVVNSVSGREHYYVQIRISRPQLVDYYGRIVQEGIERIVSLSALATGENNARKAKAMYLQIRALREDLNRDLMILGFLQVKPDYAEKLKSVPSLGEIETAIQKLSGNRVQDYEALALDISDQFDAKKMKGKSYQLSYYEWANTGFVSEFSSQFTAYLRASLENRFGWHAPIAGYAPEISLYGEMIEEGKQICLITRIIHAQEAPQTLITYINPATIAEFGRDFLLPKDLDTKLAQDMQLRQDARRSTNLQLDLRSGEYGKTPAVYRYDEKATVEVRANKACWLHLFYLEADGSKCVLVENFPVSADMVNQWILIPQDFYACPPSGIEQVWVQADLNELPAITNTTRIAVSPGFFKTILKDDLTSTIAKTRGLKIAEQDHDFSEAFLTWTVVE